MSDFEFDAAWAYRYRVSLAERHGVGTFVAVYDHAVIDWGPDEEEVRQRAEKVAGERVFVGPISGDHTPDFMDEPLESEAGYKRYRAIADKYEYRRRFSFTTETLNATDEFDITGQKREMTHGYIIIDGAERRFSDLDYRLLVEHGAIPKETELIGGVVFWKTPDVRKRNI